MPLTETRQVLHQAAEVISIFRKRLIDPLPNHLHHSLIPTPDGVRTGVIEGFGELSVDFRNGSIQHIAEGANPFTVSISGKTQQVIFDTVQAKLADVGKTPDIASPDLKTETLHFDADTATLLADMFAQMQTALARTKSHFNGGQTPLVLWSHGFDLSSIWFPQGTSMDEDSDPHMNIGFSPGTESMAEPYVYFYVYPVQDAIQQNLPSNVTWEDSWGTPGGLIPYSALAASSDTVATVTKTLLSVYEVAKQALDE